MKYIKILILLVFVSGCSYTNTVDSNDMGNSDTHGMFSDDGVKSEPLDYEKAEGECLSENPEFKWAQGDLERCIYDKTGIISVKQGQRR